MCGEESVHKSYGVSNLQTETEHNVGYGGTPTPFMMHCPNDESHAHHRLSASILPAALEITTS
jgi:hypothetical protein